MNKKMILAITGAILFLLLALSPMVSSLQIDNKKDEELETTNPSCFNKWVLDISFNSLEYLRLEQKKGKEYAVYKAKYTVKNVGEGLYLGWPDTWVQHSDSSLWYDWWHERPYVLFKNFKKHFSHEVKILSSDDPSVDIERDFASKTIVIGTIFDYPEDPDPSTSNKIIAKYWNDKPSYQPTQAHLWASTPCRYDIISLNQTSLPAYYVELPDISILPTIITEQRLGWVADLYYYLDLISDDVKQIIVELGDEASFISDAWPYLQEINNWTIDICKSFENLMYDSEDPILLLNKLCNFKNIFSNHIEPLQDLSINYFGYIKPEIEQIIEDSEGLSSWILLENWQKPILIKGEIHGVKDEETITISCRDVTVNLKDEDDGVVDSIINFEFNVSSEPIKLENGNIAPHECKITIEGDNHRKNIETKPLLSYCFSNGEIHKIFKKINWIGIEPADTELSILQLLIELIRRVII